jgi:hypothetical protein
VSTRSFHGGDTNNDGFYNDEQGIYPYIPRKTTVHAGVTKYFEPGWILTRGSFLNVEYWTPGAFSPLKIETGSRWKCTRGHFSTALHTHFFSNLRRSRNVESWPCWILTPDYRVLNFLYLFIHCARAYISGGDHKQQGEGCHFALIEQFRRRKLNVLFKIWYGARNHAAKHLLSFSYSRFFLVLKHSNNASSPKNIQGLHVFLPNLFIAMAFPLCQHKCVWIRDSSKYIGHLK